jgi:2'-5' RNA ligase
MPEAELRSALIVAVPEAAPAVDMWRERTCYAKPSSGVPPHVTVLYPFFAPDALDEALVAELREIFAAHECFGFELRTTARFRQILYLKPEPPEPFVRLTEAVYAAYPDHLPYEGAFDSVVPHLTTAEGDAEVLAEAERDVLQWLPIVAEAHEVLLAEEVEPNSARWRTRASLRLGRSVRALEQDVDRAC